MADNNKISFQDYLEITNLVSQWSTSYDTKDWDSLRLCLAPSSCLDFRSLQGELHENLTPDNYVAILEKMIGDRRLKTQHFLGVSTWTHLGEGSVEVVHQVRAAHQRYKDETLTEVANKGHGHGFVYKRFRKHADGWKIESVRPELDWAEYDLHGTLASPEKKSEQDA